MKLLLHTCCAPCLIYPLEHLKEKGFEVTGLFYNPNIHPVAEYDRRRQAAEDFNQKLALEIIYPEYIPSEFFWEINPVRNTTLYNMKNKISNGVNTKEDKPQRCSLCWHLRLKKTADVATEKGFSYFSTTLLVSPYQDQTLLKKIGDNVAKEVGIDFYYEDLRPGFRDAHNEAKAKGLYCQNYCGCVYSEVERCKKSEKH